MIPCRDHFADARLRHWNDAELLYRKERWANVPIISMESALNAV